MQNSPYKDDIHLEALSKMMPGVYLWKKNLDSVYTEINQDCAELFGITRKKDITGLTDYEIPCKIAEFADIFRKQDQLVISHGKPIKILEIHVCSKDQLKVMLNTKNPLRDKNNKIIGTFAYCMDITNQLEQYTNRPKKLIPGSHILGNRNLETILNYTKLYDPQADIKMNYNNNVLPYLTKREEVCLIHLVKGKTAQEIGNLLFISKRTVEKHLEQVKFKFQCKTKSELIDKVITCKLVSFFE